MRQTGEVCARMARFIACVCTASEDRDELLAPALRAATSCSSAHLHFALLPSDDGNWLSSSAVQAIASPRTGPVPLLSSSRLMAQARALVAALPAGAVIELVWLLPADGPAPLKEGAHPQDVDAEGAAIFCALQCARQAGLACRCTLVHRMQPGGGAEPAARRASEQWVALLQCQELVELPSAAAADASTEVSTDRLPPHPHTTPPQCLIDDGAADCVAFETALKKLNGLCGTSANEQY